MVVLSPKRKYYKYEVQPWTQPVIDSAIVWIPIGGDSFGAECDLCILEQQNDPRTNHTIARAFNGNKNSYIFHTAYNNVKGSIIFYNPIPINVTNIAFWAQSGYLYRSTRSGKIYGSNDSQEWTLIKEYAGTLPTTQDYQIDLSENTEYYKYYKLFSDGVFSRDDYWSFMTCTLTATQRTVIEGTSSDYDFYEDEKSIYSLTSLTENTNGRTDFKHSDITFQPSYMTYGNGKYVALSGNTLNRGYTSTSTDGITWTSPVQITGSSYRWYNIFFCNNKYIAATRNPVHLSFSTNGTTWTEPVEVNSRYLYDIVYANNKYVAIFSGTGSFAIAISDDCINWTEIERPTTSSYSKIFYINNQFIMIGNSGTESSGASIVKSTDGVTWTETKVQGVSYLRCLAYGNGKYVAIGNSGTSGYATTSTDGVTWTTPVLIRENTALWNSVTYGNGKFVAGSGNGDIACSTDGMNWKIQRKLNSNAITRIIYANNMFLCVSPNTDKKTIITVPDYINTIETIAKDSTIYTKKVPLANTKSLGSAKLNSNLIANDFTAANKLDTEFYFKPEASDKYTFYIKCNSGTNGNHRAVLGPATDAQGFGLWINNANKLAIYATSASGSWNIANHVVGTTVLQANTDYWLKFSFDGSKYVYSLSTDGITYTDEITINSTSVIYPMRVMLGWHANYYLVGGSIDLKETYFVVNNKVVWKGQQDLSTDSSLTLKMPNITKVGDVHAHSLKDQHIITNFSGTNYAKFPIETIPTADAQTFEANIRYKHKKAFWPLQQGIFGETIGTPTSLFVNTSGLLQLLVSSGSGYWVNATGTTKIAPNKWYDLKIEHTGDYYIVSGNDLGSGTMWTNPKQVGSKDWRSVTYANGKFVAVGGNITTSMDGVTWTTPVQVGEYAWKGVTYGNGKFVAVNYKGYTTTSTDGVTWTTPAQVGEYDWQDVIYGNGKFVAVGYKGYTTTSTDGVTWTTPVQVGSNSSWWLGVTYGNGKFVAVGGNGYTTTSTDGVTWTTPVQSGSNTWFGVTYGNNKFVAVSGSNGYTTTSTDGITWTTPVQVSTRAWNAVTYANGKFVAVGSSGYTTTSTDGVTWTTPVQVASNYWWYGITYANGKFVAVGSSGYTTTSPEIVVANTNKTPNRSNWALGCISNTYSLGEIDLEHSNIKINGETWWEGVTQEEVIDSTHYDTKTTKIRRFI